MEVMRRLVLAGFLAWMSTDAFAAGPCSPTQGGTSPTTYGERIAAIACNENTLWFSPFIDADGHLASVKVAEGEASRLGDGVTPAWRRVVEYWKGSGLLWSMTGTEGASDCAYPGDNRIQTSSCRAFVIDTPWSAAFVSYVMTRAGVPGFRSSASHIDFVRDAYLHAGSPYRFADPETEPPGSGDLLCFSRSSAVVLGHQGLKTFLDQDPRAAINMHCEVVVAANPGGNGKLHLVGGNVLQGVTLRELHLNRNGLLWSLPKRYGPDTSCDPGNGGGCSFNRQDWVVLLKLNLPTTLIPAPQTPLATPATRPPTCCLKCAPDVSPEIPRC